MIGPKKFAAIRRELHRAFTASGEDPVRLLEQRMSAPGHSPGVGGSAVAQSLRRVLEDETGRKRRKNKVTSKK